MKEKNEWVWLGSQHITTHPQPTQALSEGASKLINHSSFHQHKQKENNFLFYWVDSFIHDWIDELKKYYNIML